MRDAVYYDLIDNSHWQLKVVAKPTFSQLMALKVVFMALGLSVDYERSLICW